MLKSRIFVASPSLLFGALMVGAHGCGGKSSRGYEVEKVVGVEEQAREAVDQAPLAFQIPFQEDRDSWERARFFFAHYSESKFGESKNGFATLPGQSARFAYRVERAQTSGGFLYKVECREGEGGATPDSTFNAKNLARFIREGTIELSLLKK